jgi:1,4-dihydroxy-2-naphthoyl-CoA hydrolase
MVIWFDKEINLEKIKAFGRGTMVEHTGIEMMELGEDHLKARMPVDHRTLQPDGILHGGASCVLAETLGSFASFLVIDQAGYFCAGIEINANHIRSVKAGYVTGIVSPLHLGASTHVWDIKIYSEQGKLVCVSRLTVAILRKKS